MCFSCGVIRRWVAAVSMCCGLRTNNSCRVGRGRLPVLRRTRPLYPTLLGLGSILRWAAIVGCHVGCSLGRTHRHWAPLGTFTSTSTSPKPPTSPRTSHCSKPLIQYASADAATLSKIARSRNVRLFRDSALHGTPPMYVRTTDRSVGAHAVRRRWFACSIPTTLYLRLL